MPLRYVESSSIFNQRDMPYVGGKAAHLAELIKAGFPVPECFFITVEAYKKFIEANGLRKPIMDILAKMDYSSPDSLNAASKRIKTLVEQSRMPLIIRDAILKFYRELGGAPNLTIDFVKAGQQLPFVAVRSSAVIEDISKTSSAGQQETYLNIRGDDALISAVQACWASLYTARAVYYRHAHDQPQDTSICVIVQRMINSETSGISFTVDPTAPIDGANKIINEASWGLGETIVQGQVDPDHYVVDKTTGQILSKTIGSKKMMRIRDSTSGNTVVRDVPPERTAAQVLSDEQIVTLSAYSKRIEQLYNGQPQNVEWATERGKLYILQTRAVTVLASKEMTGQTPTGTELLKGVGASPGIATGTVRIIRDLSELGKIGAGDVLVTIMTSPDMVIAMEKSAAIVTDQGGKTCQAAIVSRELGIPAIIGTMNSTQVLKDGQRVTVDAVHGIIYSDEPVAPAVQELSAVPVPIAPPTETHSISPIDITATEIKVNVAFSDTAERVAAKADGVGLMRLEHLLTKAGMHPFEYIRQGRSEELAKIIAEGVGAVARSFAPKPVWVRTLDARTDEFRHMSGGDKEPTETNPMLGWHGIRRDLDDSELLKAQLNAFKQLHEQGLTNVAVMIPFTINVEELRKAKAVAKEIGAPDTLKFGIMVETPAAALSIEDYCKEGIAFVSFGSNDLCQLTLGIDRNNERLIKMFDEMHPGMQYQFKSVIKTCKRYGVKTSICGEAPSNRRDIVDFLIHTGIDSLSVNMDAIDKVRGWTIATERRILLDKMRR